MANPSIYHDHLDLCQQCRDRPFDNCLEGRRLLQLAADPVGALADAVVADGKDPIKVLLDAINRRRDERD